jgi:hypothetical protein
MKLLEFVETAVFARQIDNYLSPDEYRDFQAALMADPKKGAVIPGSGGLRKIRVACQGKGKRGGARIIYYLITRKGVILLLFAYPKNVQDDLGASQLKELRRAAEEVENG